MAKKQAAASDESEQDKTLIKKVDEMMSAEASDYQSRVSQQAAATNAELKAQLQSSGEKVQSSAVPVAAAAEAAHADQQAEPELAEPEQPAMPDDSTVSDSEAPQQSEEASSTKLDDADTEKAVDDIAANEGDDLLELEDAKNQAANEAVAEKAGPGFGTKLKGLLKNKWFWIVIVGLLLLSLAIPNTRYRVLGLFIKKSVTVSVIDSKNGTPVSSAAVELGGTIAKTDAEGQAKVSAGLGNQTLTVNKQYYSTYSSTIFVSFSGQQVTKVKLTATGRLVPVSVINAISGKALSGALITAQGTTAKTNSKGLASIALPTKSLSYKATVSLNGYNQAAVTILVTNTVVKANTFSLAPQGKVYFLSNASGKIDVVSTNLDGSNRKTVLAGTGLEDANDTSLLASRDWRYLVLKSKRDSSGAALYLIDTSTNKITEFDNSGKTISLIGWYDHKFMYDLTNSNAPLSQTGREVIKSYDADNLQLNQLDQNQAQGTPDNYAVQSFSGFNIVDNELVYEAVWISSSYPNATHGLSGIGLNSTIRMVQPNGQNKKDLQSFDASTISSMISIQYLPQNIYFAVYKSDNSVAYYQYDNGAVKASNITADDFSKAYPTYLVSPSSNQTFWADLIDGKNALYVGDANAGNKKQIASPGDYTPYGWYGDGYVLVAKNSSELYIMPSNGLSNGRQPLKITDYYKPAQNYAGYGYGYGGL